MRFFQPTYTGGESRNVAAALCSLLLYINSVAAKTYYVSAGQSIQAAIDGAAPGDRIQVAAGTYAQQIIINKNNIDLRGDANTILTPPAASAGSYCDGGPENANIQYITAICIHGTPGAYVSGVSVTGFTIVGGWLNGILSTYSSGTTITQAKVLGATNVGINVGPADNSKIQNNIVAGNSAPRLYCLVSVYGSGSKIAQNTISNCYTGLTFENDGADIENNEISNTCVGLNHLGGSATLISHNHIFSSLLTCADQQDVIGINIYDGSRGFTIDHNTIEGQRKGNSNNVAAIMADVGPGAITGNILRNNDANIVLVPGATGITVTKNVCSNPSTGCNY